MKGKHHSKETKRKMSFIAKQKGFGKNSAKWLIGRRQSEETIKKRIESRKGYRHSKKTKQKMIIAAKMRKRKPLSIQHRKKLSEIRKQKIKNGIKPGNWKGGKYRENGYVMVHFPRHPRCNKKGYVREHRLIIEKYIGRYLLRKEACHHINKIRDDNRPENLMAFKCNADHVYFEKWKGKVSSDKIIFDGRLL